MDPLKIAETGGAIGLALFCAWYLGWKIEGLGMRVEKLHDRILEFISRGARVALLAFVPLLMLPGCPGTRTTTHCAYSVGAGGERTYT